MSSSSQQDQLTTSSAAMNSQSSDEKLSIEFSICTFASDELKNNVANYESTKTVEIKNCPTTLEASKLISNSSFRSSLESLNSFTTLILKIDEELNEKYAEKPKSHEFQIERNFLISYESNKTVNEKIIYWKNGKEGNYLIINLMKGYSAELTDFVRDFLIVDVNMNFDNSINENHELVNLNDSSNSNLLMKAVESEQTAIVQELVNLPFDINQKSNDGKTAADIAYEKKNNQILLQLLEVDSTFPKNFNIVELETDEASKGIEEILSDSRNLHNAIAANDLAKVIEILDENSNLIYFYNPLNVSAATAAIKANKIEIYRTLLANDCSIGPEEDFNQIMNELANYEPEIEQIKKKLLATHDNSSQPLPEKHLMILCTNSIVCHDDKFARRRLKHIKEAYNNLNEIPLIKKILQLISIHKNFKIHFDFNRSSVEFINPYSGSLHTRGLCENVKMREFYVYIAAKELLLNDSENFAALGTLAHELCHFAMNLTFCNDAKPYAIDDEENEAKFDGVIEKSNVISLEISRRTKEIEKCQNKISFRENILQKTSDETSEMRKYYEMRICAIKKLICKSYEKIAINEEQIAGINVDNFKLNSHVKEFFEKFVGDPENEIYERIELNERTLTIKTNEIENIKEQIIDSEKQIEECNEGLQLCKSNHQAAITEYENKISKLEDEIKHVKDKSDYEEIVSLVFINYDENLWPVELIVRVPHMIAHYQNDTKRLNQLKVTFKDLFDYYNDVVAPKMSQTLNLLEKIYNNSNEIEFVYLTNAYKAKIHHSNVEFQGVEVKFNKIIEDKNSEIFQLLSSEQIHEILIENKSLKIGCVQEVKTKYYTERSFINYDIRVEGDYWTEEILNNLKNFEQISSIAVDSKMILLSDRAGAGKTTTFKHLSVKLKEKFPYFWISYIDLKRHLKVYEKFEQNFQAVEVLQEILSIIDELELKIFTKLFESNRVILLYDGVDEIAPKFKDFFIKLIESVRNSTTNQQWIATRPQHTKELKKKFDQIAYKLLPYDKKMKIELIEIILQNMNVENVDADEVFTNVDRMSSKGFKIDSPLMIEMMAELYVNDKTSLKGSNKFSLYEKMIEMKKDIVEEKGKIVNIDRDNQKAKLTIWQVHQIYALKLLYKNGFRDIISDIKSSKRRDDDDYKMIDINEFPLFKRWKKEKSKWTPEAISRYGFLYVDNWNTDDEFPDFTHRTFAEFFVAQFAIQDLYELDEDDDDEISEKEIEKRVNLLIRLGSDINDFILGFVDSHESKNMHNYFFKLITSNEIQKLLILLRTESSGSLIYKLIEIFTIDKRFLKEFRYSGNLTFFQYAVNEYYLNDIQSVVGIYKKYLGANWIHHTGYSLKENFLMPNHEEIDVNLILNSFNQLEIAQNVLLKFLKRHFYEFCKQTFENFDLIQKLMKVIQNNFHNCKNELLETIFNIIKYDPKSYERIIENAKEFLDKFEEFLRSDEQISDDDIRDFFDEIYLCSCGMKNLIKSYNEKRFTKSQIQNFFIKHSAEIIHDTWFNEPVSNEDFINFFKEIFDVQSDRSQLKKFLEMRSENVDEDFKNQTVLSYLHERVKSIFIFFYEPEKKKKFKLLRMIFLDLARQIEIPDDEIKKLSKR